MIALPPPAPAPAATASLRYACESDTSGYAVAARRCLLALDEAGVDVGWQPLANVPHGDVPGGRLPVPLDDSAPADLARLARASRPGETLVVHSVPQGWDRVVEHCAPGHVVGHSVWEADRLPARWRREMDLVDAFWVPTEWNRQVFLDAFDRPVHVVPHAVSRDRPEPPPVRLPEDAFVVAVVSAWDWRKRPDLALEAVLRAFGPGDDVVVVLKLPRMPVAWPYRQHVATAAHVAAVRQRHGAGPQVLLDTAEWSAGEVLGLLDRADCFLSTTAAEGWGLGAFDAACLGTPVLITGHGGQVEWLGADYPGLLPYTMVEAVHPDQRLFEPGMRWAEVDLDATVDALRALHGGRPAGLVAHAEALAPRLQERYSSSAVASAALAGLPAPASS